MQQVLHLADALHLSRGLFEVLDHAVVLDFAAKEDDAAFRVDIDGALGRLSVTKDLALDLARERDVVRLRLGLLLAVSRLLLDPVGLGGHRAAGPPGLPAALAEKGEEPVASHVAAPGAVLRVEKPRECGHNRTNAEK